MVEPKVGNTVKLISGGPDMTITVIGGGTQAGFVYCQWFDSTASKQAEWYPLEALIQAPRVGG